MPDTETFITPLLNVPADAPIQFFDLKSQQKALRPALEKRWSDILDHGRYIGGPEITEMEDKLSRLTGAVDTVAVGSGTQALILPMLAFGYGYGDAVFIPGFTYNATANAVLLTGARPVFVDIDPHTFNICPLDLERRIAQVIQQKRLKPRAIMPVDLYGMPADYPAIKAIADKYGLQIIADAAQSFGGRQKGQWVGTLAEITATSFYPTKTLGGYGDGGAILTTSKSMAQTLRSIRWHGTGTDKKNSIRVGLNGRCDSIQSAVILEKLTLFEEERARCLKIDSLYRARLGAALPLQDCPVDTYSACGLFTVRVPHRQKLRAELADWGIPTAIYYDTPLHRMHAFERLSPPGGLPACEKAAEEVLSLPMHAYLSEAQIHRICDVLLDCLKRM